MIRHWTTSEYRLINDNPSMTNKQIAEIIGRSENAIWRFRNANGLKRVREGTWQPHEIEFLRVNRKRKNKEIGDYLGRTAKAVQGARDRFDLQKRSAE